MLVIFLVVTTFSFAALAIYFSWDDEQRHKKSTIAERENKRQVFELTLLNSITEKIGYSLNLESVAEIIALTAENLFNLSTVSYAIRSGSKIKVKTLTREIVGTSYLDEISKIIIVSMTSIDSSVMSQTVENVQMAHSAGENTIVKAISESNIAKPLDTFISDQMLSAMPVTYFNVPLIINKQLAGMINIASKRKIEYEEEDVALLHKIIDKAQKTIEKLEEVIKNEESKLESLILSLPQGTIMFTIRDKSYVVSVVNQAAKDFLRISEGVEVYEVISKFDPALKIGEQVQNVFTTKTSASIKDVKIYDRDFTIVINPVFAPQAPSDINPGGQRPLIGVALILRDMTAEKKLEKMRLDFTDMMVHELRSPTTAIRGAAALLISTTLSPKEKEKMPRIILDCANEMLATVSDFLEISRIDEGKFKLNLEKQDLVKIISEHVDVFSYAAREKNLTISFDKNTSAPLFFFDSVRVGQVINNLLSNSIKFTDDGGKIEIQIEKKDGSAPGAEGAQILVTVLDNGIGVPEAKKPLLFTKFGQINQRLGRGGSSGLGLFISREIVEAHGGRIWLESPIADGHGTRVIFELPLRTEEHASASTAAAQLSN